MSVSRKGSKSRFKLRNKVFKVKSSKIICEERLACKGVKPFADFFCEDCHSHQCEACEALLHENFRLAFHQRCLLPKPPIETLCDGNCRERNFADVRCTSCDKKFCFSCDFNIHFQGKESHIRTKFEIISEEFLSCEEYIGPLSNSNSDRTAEQVMLPLVSNEDVPDLFPEQDKLSHFRSKSNINSFQQKKSFLLINDKEQLQVKSADDFSRLLGCSPEKLVKVVSIFGNTGDGKSYTLNHAFYEGEEVFKTSAAQSSCTVGVWAAYSPFLDIVTIDTEGFLGQASNENRRARLLLKILAISDIVIYRTRAERLHNDMFQFLGDASLAYSRHFAQELEDACARCNIKGPHSVLGPAVIVFHETQHTKVLCEGSENDTNVQLQIRFRDLGLKLDAFSGIEYIGLQTKTESTDFEPLKNSVQNLLKNSSVRMARSSEVIYKVLKVLNDKFCGDIEKVIPSTFPDQYFTCSTCCLSCKSRCSNSMNHVNEGLPHVSSVDCVYQHQYENHIFLCKNCFERGEKVIVTPKTMESSDSSWFGFAKYAWSGYILECSRCGVIYRNRQYWYGNKDPWLEAVRIEISHVWPNDDGDSKRNEVIAQSVLDQLTSVSTVVTTLSSKPTRMLTDWVADKIAPSYWVPNSDITHCGLCDKEFEEQDAKHHCRACGGGFCENCSSHSRVVSMWGSSPVRVCDKCFEDEQPPNIEKNLPPSEVTVRKLGEVVHSTLGTVATAVNYPISIIKDTARPSYWVPDHLLTQCHVCKEQFGPKLRIHHCRACGEGVCHPCSAARLPVPSRGWDYAVRVCKLCENEEKL